MSCKWSEKDAHWLCSEAGSAEREAIKIHSRTSTHREDMRIIIESIAKLLLNEYEQGGEESPLRLRSDEWSLVKRLEDLEWMCLGWL